jgi:hypothetical protein
MEQNLKRNTTQVNYMVQLGWTFKKKHQLTTCIKEVARLRPWKAQPLILTQPCLTTGVSPCSSAGSLAGRAARWRPRGQSCAVALVWFPGAGKPIQVRYWKGNPLLDLLLWGHIAFVFCVNSPLCLDFRRMLCRSTCFGGITRGGLCGDLAK